jgi:hypothetical protein
MQKAEKNVIGKKTHRVSGAFFAYRLPSCQQATALAAATFSESTPWDIGILTV